MVAAVGFAVSAAADGGVAVAAGYWPQVGWESPSDGTNWEIQNTQGSLPDFQMRCFQTDRDMYSVLLLIPPHHEMAGGGNSDVFGSI